MSGVGLVIFAALPREIGALVRGTTPDAKWLQRGIHLHTCRGAVVIAAGMGESRIAAGWQAARECGALERQDTWVVSTGLAGSCTAALTPGQVCVATAVVDTLTGERWQPQWVPEGMQGAVLASSGAIASVGEKRRLHEAYGAGMVDMEAAAVARLAEAAGLRFAAVKAVSDSHDFELQSLARFASPRGHFRTGAFALHTAVRPHRWRHAVRLGRDSNRALTALTGVLRRMIDADRNRATDQA